MILRSNTAQAIGLGAIAIGGCAIGIGFDRPTFTAIALATITPAIIVQKERSKDDRRLAEIQENNLILRAQCEEQQKQITLLGTENTSLCGELKKLKEKTAKQETRQRLVLSKLDKVQHSVKVALRSPKVTNIQPKKAEIAPSFEKPKTTTLVSEIPVRESCTYVYVDGNNLRYACEQLGIEFDYNNIRIEFSQDATKTQFKYYVGVHSRLTWQQKQQLLEINKGGYEVITFPLVKRDDGKWKTVGDDVKLAIDMAQEVKSGDRVILVSGDGDFIPAIEAVKNRGVKVTVVAHPQMLNEQLETLADNFISLEEIKYKIAKHKKLVIAKNRNPLLSR